MTKIRGGFLMGALGAALAVGALAAPSAQAAPTCPVFSVCTYYNGNPQDVRPAPPGVCETVQPFNGIYNNLGRPLTVYSGPGCTGSAFVIHGSGYNTIYGGTPNSFRG